MTKKTFTKEERAAYFTKLRAGWASAKAQAGTDTEAQAMYQEAQASGVVVSMTGFYFTLIQMRAQRLAGSPYIDAKTFKGWLARGFMVRKGEHSKIEGITWIMAKGKEGDDEDKGGMYPKGYHLFHSSQVEAVTN